MSLLSALLVTVSFFTTNRIATSSIWYSLDGYDHHRYIEMATGHLFDFHLAPFCWRILDPLIVKLQPFGFEAGFLWVTLISLWLCGIVVYYLTKAAGFVPVYGLFSLILFFSLGWVIKQNVFDFWLPDALGYLFVLAAIYAIYKKLDLLFVTLLAIGVLAKESVFFVAPLYYTLNATKVLDLKVLRRTLLFCHPCTARVAPRPAGHSHNSTATRLTWQKLARSSAWLLSTRLSPTRSPISFGLSAWTGCKR